MPSKRSKYVLYYVCARSCRQYECALHKHCMYANDDANGKSVTLSSPHFIVCYVTLHFSRAANDPWTAAASATMLSNMSHKVALAPFDNSLQHPWRFHLLDGETQSAESSRRGRAPGQPVPGTGSCQTRGIPAKNKRPPPLELQKRGHELSWRCRVSQLRSGKPFVCRGQLRNTEPSCGAFQMSAMMKPEGVLTDPGSVPLFFCVLCKMERRDSSFTPPTQEHHTPVTTDLLTQGGKDIAFADYSPLWKNHRRLVHSSFTLFGEGSSKLQTIEAADSLCEELQSCRGQSSDLSPVLMRAVTNVICRLVFSSSYQPNDPELLKVMDYNDGIVQTIARGGLVDVFPWLRIFPNKDLKKLKECVCVRDQLLRKKLQEHKMTLTPGEPRDLLDALLIGQMKGSGGEDDITEDHVLMTAAEAFGAGVQDRVQAELDECLGRDRPPSLSDRSRLPFLDAVLCEVMRIRPVSPILIPHVAMQDTGLGGHMVPKGTRVLVNMWAIHHDPKHWDEPDRFRPERFLDSSGKRATPASFLPFGAGPRVCVGESLSRIELFLFVSRLLQRFDFSVPSGASLPDLQGRFGVVLQPQRYTVRVTPRR
ncbi:Steroid 17-alpha-hydroxylase/17,20 lyase [Anabarilius grahami]|uniref:Steroid 17-alpha-hydroxylase/17,20 lyase n=1 Tax=Anabarilius grahami TaxID=495550 RepID=A0A3N0Y2A1_ANAGA|nr:Steroid 17-alpha-hydroxylase/17,20 lyase [Anabarilius grahami]